MFSPDRLAYSLPEASKALGLSVGMVRKIIRSGKLPARKAGERVLVLATDLKAYVEALPPVEVKTDAA